MESTESGHAWSSSGIGTNRGSTWPKGLGTSSDLSPGGAPWAQIGPGDCWMELGQGRWWGGVLNGIAQGKGKDNQEAGLGEAVGSLRQQAEGAGWSRGGATHPRGSQELWSRAHGLAHGSLGAFQGAKSV